MTTWGFLGCGNLSQAIILGALKKKVFSSQSVLISNRTYLKSKKFRQKTKVRIAKNNTELIRLSDIIFVGTKPQDIEQVLSDLKRSNLKNKIIISLAAGVDSSILKKSCSQSRSLFRVMGNTPVTIQKGFFGILPVKQFSSDKNKIFSFFEKLGQPIIVKNDFEINVITAGSGSGVGFVFSFMEEFEAWFKKMGLRSSHARLGAVETFLGAAELARSNANIPISELREKVTSKKGTTLAGLIRLKKEKVGPRLRSGLAASFNRSSEIAKSLRQKQK